MEAKKLEFLENIILTNYQDDKSILNNYLELLSQNRQLLDNIDFEKTNKILNMSLQKNIHTNLSLDLISNLLIINKKVLELNKIIDLYWSVMETVFPDWQILDIAKFLFKNKQPISTPKMQKLLLEYLYSLKNYNKAWILLNDLVKNNLVQKAEIVITFLNTILKLSKTKIEWLLPIKKIQNLIDFLLKSNEIPNNKVHKMFIKYLEKLEKNNEILVYLSKKLDWNKNIDSYFREKFIEIITKENIIKNNETEKLNKIAIIIKQGIDRFPDNLIIAKFYATILEKTKKDSLEEFILNILNSKYFPNENFFYEIYGQIIKNKIKNIQKENNSDNIKKEKIIKNLKTLDNICTKFKTIYKKIPTEKIKNNTQIVLAYTYVLIHEKNISKAIKINQEFLKKDKDDNFEIRQNYVNLLYEEKDFWLLEKEFKKLLDKFPKKDSIYILGIKIYKTLNKPIDEISDFIIRAYQIAPKNIDIIFSYIDLLIYNKDLNKAIQILESKIKDNPTNHPLLEKYMAVYNLNESILHKKNIQQYNI